MRPLHTAFRKPKGTSYEKSLQCQHPVSLSLCTWCAARRAVSAGRAIGRAGRAIGRAGRAIGRAGRRTIARIGCAVASALRPVGGRGGIARRRLRKLSNQRPSKCSEPLRSLRASLQISRPPRGLCKIPEKAHLAPGAFTLTLRPGRDRCPGNLAGH